jgi:phytanoyl-CoA hydroxylase
MVNALESATMVRTEGADTGISGLTPQQIEQYRRDGFVVIRSLFSQADIDRLIDTIDRLISDAQRSNNLNRIVEFETETVDGLRVPRRLFNPFEQHEEFRRVAKGDRLVDRVVSLVGPNVALQHSKLNMKPSKVGAVVEWHQDLTYFPHTNDDLVAALIYLDNATIANGCLQLLPGNHRRFFDHAFPDGTFAGMITEEIADGRWGKPISVEGSVGTVIFLHPLTPHSSAPNISTGQRRVLIFQYRAADSFPIYNGAQIVSCEECAHHIRGTPALFARFGGPPPAIYKPAGKPRSLYELQESSRSVMRT